MVSILRTESRDGRYLGMVLLIAMFSMSSIILIMLPKVLAFFEIYGGQTARRGARVGTRVTGMSTTSSDVATAGSSRLANAFSGASSGNKRSDLQRVPETTEEDA